MTTGNKKKSSLRKRLRARFQFSVMNEENYEVQAVRSLSVMNIILYVFSISLMIGGITFAIIAFTPIKQYIPGYGRMEERRAAIQHHAMADSIGLWAEQVQLKLDMLSKVLSGEIDTGIPAERLLAVKYDSLQIFSISREDSILRAEVESRERFTIFEDEEGATASLSQLSIFPPLRGEFSDTFNARAGHYGIDIVAANSRDVKSILDGRVVMAEFTIETGHVIAIQHDLNLLSIYKHNSELTRKVGNFIRQGEVIAISGNSGEYTSGPHLHFELWYNGEPLDPARYINFD